MVIDEAIVVDCFERRTRGGLGKEGSVRNMLRTVRIEWEFVKDEGSEDG